MDKNSNVYWDMPKNRMEWNINFSTFNIVGGRSYQTLLSKSHQSEWHILIKCDLSSGRNNFTPIYILFNLFHTCFHLIEPFSICAYDKREYICFHFKNWIIFFSRSKIIIWLKIRHNFSWGDHYLCVRNRSRQLLLLCYIVFDNKFQCKTLNYIFHLNTKLIQLLCDSVGLAAFSSLLFFFFIK